MEEWKWIPGYEGRYKVYRDGRIWSELNEIFLKGGNTKGYLTVMLAGRGYRVHRLVAEAFVSNPESKPEVNHDDGNKLNNNDWNLKWSTAKENQAHAWATGLAIGAGRGPKLSREDAIAIRASNDSELKLAETYGVGRDQIDRIRRGVSWRSAGGVVGRRRTKKEMQEVLDMVMRGAGTEELVAVFGEGVRRNRVEVNLG